MSGLNGSYELFVLSVDDLEWTDSWLAGERCDSLHVWIASTPEAQPRVRMRAVESKASTSTKPVSPQSTVEPFAKASGQVVATLAAISEVLFPTEGDPLVDDLRFASLIEHIASVALADLYPISAGEPKKVTVIETINELSTRQLGEDDILLDGMAVCTQYRTAAKQETAVEELGSEKPGGPWPVYLIRCGTDEVKKVIGEGLGDIVLPMLSVDDKSDDSGPTLDESDRAPSPPGPGGEGDYDSESGATEHETPGEDTDDQTLVLARDLYLACRQRGFAVSEPESPDITQGPSLISIPMALDAGASIRPIESALEDLARELGIQSLEVENDPDRAYYVRFLAARKDRHYPQIPASPAPLVETETSSYLGVWMGQDLQGRDVSSFVSSWPHMLVSGTTGSGKTTFMKSVLRQFGTTPGEAVDIVIIDGKGEFDYFGAVSDSHLSSEFPEVQLGHSSTLTVLEWVVEEEIPRRRGEMKAFLAASGRQNVNARQLFAEGLAESLSQILFPPLVVVIDEFAEIMQSAGSSAQEFERRIQQVSQIGRSTLVHLMLATQRPDASVIKGAIKANLDARVALRLPTHHDSMTVLGSKGAERLLGNGDFIFQSGGQARIRLQGYAPPS